MRTWSRLDRCRKTRRIVWRYGTGGRAVPPAAVRRDGQAVDQGRVARKKAKNPSKRRIKYGANLEYTLARLDRDASVGSAQAAELAAQVRAGTLSANTAAIQAGFRKQREPLDRLRHWWKRASEAERERFLAEVRNF